MTHRLLAALVAVLLAMPSVHAASVVSGYPNASQPLGNIPDAVLLDQGTGCPNNVPPCTTSKSPSLRVGQPFQSNSAPNPPFKYQLWWDTTTAGLPKLKIYDGSTWNLIATLNTSAHSWLPIFPNQTANTVYAGPPTGAAATPAFRALVGADLPNPSATTLGGVKSLAQVPHFFLDSISNTGVPHASQPVCADLSNAGNGCSNAGINAHRFLGGPVSGGLTAPTFRAIDRTDVPVLAGMLDGISYGITADGVTSDDAALLAALAACSSSGGKTLWLPQGRILLTGVAGPIPFKNCNMVGQGVANTDTINRGTTFLLTSTTVAPFTIGSNVGIRGLNFWWPNQINGTTVFPALFSDDGTNHVSQLYMDDVVVINAYDFVKLTTGVSQGPFDISNAYFYCVHDCFTLSNTGDSWRMTNIHFTPGPWLNTCAFCGAVITAVNAADQHNSMFHITGDGTGQATVFVSNSSAFAWRYGFLLDTNAALFSDIQIAMDGVSTYLDTSSGGLANGSTFRGSGSTSSQIVYGGSPTGNHTAFNLGANGDVTLDGFISNGGRGTFIHTLGSNVIIHNSTANFGSAADGGDYYCFQNGGVGRLDIYGLSCFGQASTKTHGFYSHTAAPITVSGSLFLNVNEALDIVTTGNLYTQISGNTSASTVGTDSVIMSGTGQVGYSSNNFDKPPHGTVSACATSPSVTGAMSGLIQVGTGGPVSSCTLTLPWVPVGTNGVCSALSSIGALSVGGLAGTPPAWTFTETTAADITGAQIFFNCLGLQ